MRAALLLAVTALLASWALWVMARPARPQHPSVVTPLFARMDTDGNGSLDEVEYRTVSSPRVPLKTLDISGDGAISPAELEAFLVEVSPAEFECNLKKSRR